MNRRRTTRREDRGAVAVIVGVSAAVLVLVASYCVDLGMQRVVRTDMQSVADVAALDMARELAAGTEPGTSTWTDALTRSLQENDTTLGKATGRSVESVCTDKVCAEATAGTVDGNGVFSAGDVSPDAVKVTTSAKVDFAFRRGSGAATRSAVASTAPPQLCFSVGTTTLSLDTSKSALSPLLAHILMADLKVAGYEGLVHLRSLDVPIAGLLAHFDIGSVDEVATTNVSLDGFLVAAAEMAADQHANTTEVKLLNSLATQVPSITFPLGDILSLATGTDTTGLTARANLFDLVSTAIFAADAEADGDHRTPDDWGIDGDVVVPGLGTGVTVKITRPPQIACGGAADMPTAREAQIEVGIASSLGAVAGLIARGSVDLNVKVGDGSAILTDVGCSTPPTATFDVHTTGVRIDEPSSPPYGQVELTALAGALGGVASLLTGQLGVDVGVGAAVASAEEPDQTVTYPGVGLPDTLTVASTAASGDILTLQDVNADVTTTGGILSTLTNLLGGVDALTNALISSVVKPVINGTVDPLLSNLLEPLVSALGAQVGTADVSVESRPACSGVRLVG